MMKRRKSMIKRRKEIGMEFICAEEKQWKEIKTIYMEAFPKRERKPYFALRHSVKTKKAVVMAATEGEQVLGFIVLIPYKDMVMADYLAVSSKVRSRGTVIRLQTRKDRSLQRSPTLTFPILRS